MTQNVPSEPTSEDPSAPDHAPAAVDTLKQAMRRARTDEAARSGARAEMRSARLGRLELLQDALQPLLAQIPPDVDMFDVALVPSSDPRLFIDMIGFVEMGRDGRLYRLQQDTRHGRIDIAESEALETMVDAVTDYVARRLLERDKSLASDARVRNGGRWIAREAAPQRGGADVATPLDCSPEQQRRTAPPLRWASIAFAFLIDLLGAIAFFTIVGALCWYAWMRLHAPM